MSFSGVPFSTWRPIKRGPDQCCAANKHRSRDRMENAEKATRISAGGGPIAACDGGHVSDVLPGPCAAEPVILGGRRGSAPAISGVIGTQIAAPCPALSPEQSVRETEARAKRRGFAAFARDERRAADVGRGLARVLHASWRRVGPAGVATGLRWLFAGWHLGAIIVALGEALCGEEALWRRNEDEWAADVCAALVSSWDAEHAARLVMLLAAGCPEALGAPFVAQTLSRLEKRTALLVASHVSRLSR